MESIYTRKYDCIVIMVSYISRRKDNWRKKEIFYVSFYILSFPGKYVFREDFRPHSFVLSPPSPREYL